MGKTVALDRVAADLSRGLTHPAIQRLSSLVAAYPTDLDLRRRLAAVHRRVGNRIQAGRWDYLTIGADAADTSAFERAFPSAAARLRAVRWPHRAGAAATSYARGRLAKLISAAAAETAGRETAAATPTPDLIGRDPAAAGSTPAISLPITAGRPATGAPVPDGRPGPVRLLLPRGRFAFWLRQVDRPARRPAPPVQVRGRWGIWLVTGGAAATALVAVGAATVIEWIVL